MEMRTALSQEIITECEIDAPADKVYSVLSDFSRFPLWTNHISLPADAKPGVPICFIVNDPSGGIMKLKSRIIKLEQRMIVFEHIFKARFMLSCIHRYEIVPLSDNKTKFINAEVFRGLSVPIVRKKKLLINARQFKDDFNAALKERVEHLDAAG